MELKRTKYREIPDSRATNRVFNKRIVLAKPLQPLATVKGVIPFFPAAHPSCSRGYNVLYPGFLASFEDICCQSTRVQVVWPQNEIQIDAFASLGCIAEDIDVVVATLE